MPELTTSPATYVVDVNDLADPDESAWSPTERHLALCQTVEDLLERVMPVLPWLAGWTLSVKPIMGVQGSAPARIQSLRYVREAIIEIRESLQDEIESPEGNYTLRATILHELTHLLVEPMRLVFYNWATESNGLPLPAQYVMRDAEEPIVWMICRLLDDLLPADLSVA